MAIKILSFLGTNEYIHCNYIFEEKYKIDNQKYFQIALGEYFIKHKREDIELIVFCTEEAVIKNYENSTRKTRDGISFEYIGLKALLNENELLSNKYKIISNGIPKGTSKNEIWEIFKVILDEIKPGDEIVFDVTHGFRSLPLMAMVIINYAKYTMGVNIKGIYYGAFERLGPAYEVKEMPMEERNADALDLSAFNLLIDWIIGMEKYLSSGEASMLKSLVQEMKFGIDNNNKISEEVNILENWVEKINQFSTSVGICDSSEISRIGNEIKEDVQAAKEVASSMLPTLDKAMYKIEEKFEVYKVSDIVNNVHETTKWCSEHNMIQQGYTLLRENIITFIYEKLELENSDTFQKEKEKYINNPKNKQYLRNANIDEEAKGRVREHISNALIRGREEYDKRNNFDRNKHKPRVKLNSEDKLMCSKVSDESVFLDLWNSEINSNIYFIFKKVREPRNYIDHAGYISNKGTEKKLYKKILQEIIEEFSKIIKE